MLTKRENLVETLKGEQGHPDRFVNQYEPFSILYATPVTAQSPMPTYGGPPGEGCLGRLEGVAGGHARRFPAS